jgi:osmotically-inducible protein OsmY
MTAKSHVAIHRADADILGNATHALHQRRTVPETVRARVDGGVVTLTGSVHLPFERAEAEDAVRSIDGVQRIVNEIAVTAPAAGFEPPDDVC